MSGLAHIWFDVDGTLYRQNEELEARIFNSMFNTVSKLLKITLGETTDLYEVLYKQTESHTKTFERLGLPADAARKAYNHTNIADYVEEDSRLMRMFDFFASLEIPCSIYSNNYSSTVDAVVAKLGIEKNGKRILFKIPGEFFPKGSDETFYVKSADVSLETDTTKVEPENASKETDTTKVKSVSGFKRIIELSNTEAGRILKPEEILFVGDREKMDIRPAKKYGFRAARVLWTPEVDFMKSDADYKLADIYQLSSIVESLAR